MWIYEQATGRILHNKDFVGCGYSGAGQAKNDPKYQDVKNVGCIPKGLYTIVAPHDSPRTGVYTLSLFPAKDNQMFGRFAFAIHGDSKANPGTASTGCIILPRNIREKVWNSKDNKLQVI